MSKAVLISIRPKWCELIVSGEKTVEVRKTKPKLETPFKCYIYCTNKRPFLVWGDVFRGDWETEFTSLYGYSRKEAERIWDVFNGRVMGEFVCDTFVTDNTFGHDALFNRAACMSEVDAAAYSLGSQIYGWHITNLEVYDTPKELSEFRKSCTTQNCDICQFLENTGEYAGCLTSEMRRLHRPPQSWCYVEELEVDDD